MAIELPSKAIQDALAAQIAGLQGDGALALLLAQANTGLIEAGEASIPRLGVVAAFTPVVNNTHHSYFTAARTETITKVTAAHRNTAAVGTTDARIGVYEHDLATNQLTRVAITANNTALWNTAFAGGTEVPFVAPFQKVAGRRYAIALRITATTMPNFTARQGEVGGTQQPYLNGYSFGTDLPASLTAPAGVSGAQSNIYYELRR